MLAMLSAMRYAEHCRCCKLDSGALLGSFSASGLEQNTHVDLLLHPNKLRKKESQRTRSIDGLLLPQVSYFLTTLKSRYRDLNRFHDRLWLRRFLFRTSRPALDVRMDQLFDYLDLRKL